MPVATTNRLGCAAKGCGARPVAPDPAGDVDRSKLSEEYSAFLSPERLAAMRESLVAAGEITRSDAGPIRERGGLRCRR